MSNAKQETIADIVAALRAVAYIQTAESPRDVLEFADRIEAAARRECEIGAVAAQICGEIGEMIGREATREKSSQVGNAAKIRERAEELKAQCLKICGRETCDHNGDKCVCCARDVIDFIVRGNAGKDER